MPDQSSASTEHALMQEITAPLATLPDDPVPIAAAVEFPTSLRGYDRIAVDAYVQKTTQLVAELQATRSPEAAVRRALERVGEQVSDILKRAHDTAGQITAQSRSEAEDRLETARQEAAEIIAGAEARVRELDAETDRIWAERHRIVDDTQALARELLALTKTADERFPAAAGEAEVDVEAVEAVDEPAEGEPVLDGAEEEDELEGAPGDREEDVDAVADDREEDVDAVADRESDIDEEAADHEPEAPGRQDPGIESAQEPDIESTAVLPTVQPADKKRKPE